MSSSAKLRLTVVCGLVSLGAAAVSIRADHGRAPQPPQQAPSRQAAAEPATGTGRVAGRVVAADTGAPVRQATVRLSGPARGQWTAMTDIEGVFGFTELPAGRFTLSAAKAGFVTAYHGQVRRRAW
jgi:hypothetical protein